MELNKNIVFILKRIQDSGFEAFIVGGAVRDYLMGQKAHDFDIATNAKPLEIQNIFKDQQLILSGLKHGTVAVVLKHEIIEITTYRLDGEYLNHRQPESVTFVSDLKSDIMRRDFTMNGLAFDQDLKIIDYVGGVKDIKNKTIRTIGDPSLRFNEDALRILRALRFKATLDFEIEENTKKAILNLYPLLLKVATERKQDEFNKLLLSDNCFKVINEYSKVFQLKLKTYFEKDDDLIVRLSCLLIDNNLDIDYLKKNKYSNKIIKDVQLILNYYHQELNQLNICHILNKSNKELCLKIIKVNKKYCCYNLDSQDILNNIISNNIPYKTSMLLIDVTKLDIQDNYKGMVLNTLLDKVINQEINNNEEELLEAYMEIKKCLNI